VIGSAAAPNGPVIETRGLTKIYSRSVRALDGLDLSVQSGELVGFLGPNGAGKTTTVHLLIGTARPTAGSATVLGRPAGDREARRWLGYLPEQFQFQGFLNPRTLLDFHGRLLGLPREDRKARSAELIRIMGLEAETNRQLKTFSKGMLQRIGLAQALLGRPALLLLDEPTSGLDPIGTRNVRNLLLWLKDQGVSVFLNSHLLSEVELVCDRVVILNRGRIVEQGRIDDIIRPVSAVRFRARDLPDVALARLREVTSELGHEGDGWWRASIRDPSDVPLVAQAVVECGGRLEGLVPEHETLEEAFLRLIGVQERSQAAPPGVQSTAGGPA
jgi:ABC-2 type transport system ATP-binding protein